MLNQCETYFFKGTALLLVLLTLPLLFELLTLSVAALVPVSKRKKYRIGASTLLERIVVLVPSHNEQASIRACVESIAASLGQASDIVVIAHNCQDETAQRAREAGASVFELNQPELRGKGHAMVYGFDVAFRERKADAVLIIDADSRISTNLVARVREGLRDAMVVQCRYDSRGAVDSSKSRLRALSFLGVNVVRPTGRQRLGLSCGILGNGFALRREVLDLVPYDSHSIVEDVEFHLSLVSAGIRTAFLEDATVSAEVPPSAAGIKTQSVRWEGGRIRMLLSRGPALFRLVLRGRFALGEPLLDLAGLPLAIEVLLLFAALLVPIRSLRFYAFFGLVTIAFHLTVAIRLSPDPAGDLRALLSAPSYLLMKATMLPAIFNATGRGAKWTRTDRTSDLPVEEKR